MRIAIAEISQETDTFNPIPTGLKDFEQAGLFFGDEILEKMRDVRPIGGFLAAAEEEPEDVQPLPIVQAWAIAGGRMTAETLEFFEEKLVSGLKKVQPLHGVFLSLHGAAAVETVDDLEGYLLRAVREMLGDDVPVVVALDHHANVTQLMIESADVLVGHETQPHIPFETGVKAAKTLFALVKGEISPTVGWQKIPMIAPQDQFVTSGGPMKEWFDLAREIERRPGVVSVSSFPLQPWLDVEEAGWSAVVYTEDDPGLARELAARLANRAWALRAAFYVSERLSPQEAIRQAEEAEAGLFILSDTGDALYAGAPGDSTCLLKEMLKQGIESTAFLPMVDPGAVEEALRAGVGSEITVMVGGKQDIVFSEPVEVTGRVTAVSDGLKIELQDRAQHAQPWLDSLDYRGSFVDLGRTVLLEVDSIKLVLTERRSFAINQPIMYTHLGLDVGEAKMVVVKTAVIFQYFAPWRKGLIRVDSPGMTQSNLKAFDWERVPRPIYPLDELPDWGAQA
jgi:microcystin degradation protein MlrC